MADVSQDHRMQSSPSPHPPAPPHPARSTPADAGPAPDPFAGTWVWFERIVAAGLVVLLGTGLPVVSGVSVATVALVLLAPVWLRTAASYRFAPLLGTLLVVALVTGVWLADLASADHVVHRAGQILYGGTLVGVAVGVGFLLWARTKLPLWLIGLLFGIGMLAAIRTDGNFSISPWRFGFATPVTVIALSLALRAGRRWAEVVVAVLLAAASVAAGGRSPAAILVLVAVMMAWQLRRPPRSHGVAAARATVMLAGLAYAAYSLGQAVILEGLLGEAARERTLLQLHQSGNLVVGGRPELAAAAALLREFPAGFGLGVVPNAAEIQVAKTGMVGINYDPDNNYVETYLFGSSFVLHSGIGELWAWLGLPGLVLALTLFVVVVRGIVTGITARAAPAVMLFAALLTLWNLCFSPTLSSAPIAMLCLGLLLTRRPTAPPGRAAELDPLPDPPGDLRRGIMTKPGTTNGAAADGPA
ncbi:hypothetical protein [Cellulomonas fengjieae]|uniref:O-antigen polymerase n=1 Tax=Cellulomonas fengjieae TaxID=2819978 RepID=A0ABS3SLC6_9CELL|nr:hypothetical protein [Cellulomonas fengjieae]MBO3086538.1 hypothetical protein [Cellulomonas fengjieae]QVI66605.1 hypothetical protein KG102_03100 [Cellulomonas fengjieae]